MSNTLDLSSEVLRRMQLVQLEILLEFDRICKEHNLKYQLFAGTLLGAIRHKGFIPWDDDIDVIMKRDEYDKFINICKSNPNDKYFLQNYETDPNFFRQFSRLRKNNTLCLQKAYKDINMHHGIFIDIFPLDNVKTNSIAEKLRYKLLYFLMKVNFIRNRSISKKSHLVIKRVIARIVRSTNIILNNTSFNKLKTKVMKIYNNKHTGYLNHMTNGTTTARFHKYLISFDDYTKTIERDFEGYKFPIPENYDKILTNIFGDYMKLPPKDMQRSHHGIIEIKF